jgi:hypothetical protein
VEECDSAHARTLTHTHTPVIYIYIYIYKEFHEKGEGKNELMCEANTILANDISSANHVDFPVPRLLTFLD